MLKSEVKDSCDEEPTYPCLMEGQESGNVYLMSGVNCGTLVLRKEGLYKLGDTNLRLDMAVLRPYTKTIELIP